VTVLSSSSKNFLKNPYPPPRLRGGEGSYNDLCRRVLGNGLSKGVSKAITAVAQ